MSSAVLGAHAPLADTPLVFIDLETTGTRATRDRITEIAALRVVDGEIVDRFTRLIDPQTDIPARIAALTGIDNAMVAGAPGFAAVADDFAEWLGEDPLVAHNARFDYSFLRNEFRRLERPFRRRVICTLKLSRALDPEHARHGLDALIERHGLPCHPPRHRALGDAQTLVSLWQYWAGHHDVDLIERLVADQQRRRSLPADLDPGLLDELPARPGVYLFYGHNKLPLYVGKSVNLRSRVLDHFSSDHASDREMKLCQQIRDLDWIETAGDLGAQLLEARLIKQLTPIHNRRLRRRGALTSWQWPHGTTAPVLVGQETLNSMGKALNKSTSEMKREAHGTQKTRHNMRLGDFSSTTQRSDSLAQAFMQHFLSGGPLYGMFRSRKEATRALSSIVEQHALCPRVMGLERGSGRCFAYQIKRCRGACCGEESLDVHERRAREALERLRVQSWPWRGRVAFRECAADGEAVYHLVDHWCYLGSVAHPDEQPEAQQVAFDVDTYKILTRFLHDQPDNIDVIEPAA
ncbi:exonuclease domain-containing protein [Kushneria aurantia]|uniref:DNA-directed DNA polymerase n=1 Tax=Kushneria aurantia TaxID=504092 RepID=A0ABV6G3Z9_9GAMM|nr:exonuclease domain-containing protein [Kushneria aurantia]